MQPTNNLILVCAGADTAEGETLAARIAARRGITYIK